MKTKFRNIFLGLCLMFGVFWLLDSSTDLNNEIVSKEVMSLEVTTISNVPTLVDHTVEHYHSPIAISSEQESFEIPLMGLLSLFEHSEDISLIEKFIEDIKAEENSERDLWIKQWPSPQNPLQELLLYTVSSFKHPSKTLGSFSSSFTEVGLFLDQQAGHEINSYLLVLMESAKDIDDAETFAILHKYNSEHAVDYEIGKTFLEDLDLAISGKMSLTDESLEILFKALLSDQQTSYLDKKNYGESLLRLVSGSELRTKLHEELQYSVNPLVEL